MDEIASLKLPELKKECKSRGLSVAGNKSDLVARLTAAMAAEKPPSDDSALDDALIDEDSMLDEDSSGAGSSNEENSNVVDLNSPTSLVPPTTVLKGSPEKKGEAVKRPASATTSPMKTTSQTNGSAPTTTEDGSPPKKKIVINREPLPTPAPTVATSESADTEDDKKVVKITALSAEEKLKLRQAKFGADAAVSDDVPKKAPNPASAASVAVNPFLDERKKKRAERFGAAASTTASPSASTATSTGKISLTTEEDVRLAKRKERFGASEIIAEDKKSKRAERFSTSSAGTPTSSEPSTPSSVKVSSTEVDEKKKQRAARFAGAP